MPGRASAKAGVSADRSGSSAQDGETPTVNRPRRLTHIGVQLGPTCGSGFTFSMEPNPYAERLGELQGEEIGNEEPVFAKNVWRHLGIETISAFLYQLAWR
jgi:hypothetical protein